MGASDARFRVVVELEPRFRDTDAMGHVNNAVYVTYLEVARQAYWKRLEQDASHDYRKVPFILAHVTIDFRAEALVSDVLHLGVCCSWIGNRSFGFDYEIREKREGRLLVEAKTVQVCYDYEAKQSITVPDALRRGLEGLEGRSLARTVTT